MNEIADKYVKAWVDEMIFIWREKIERMKIVRSGALHESFKQEIQTAAEGASIRLAFLRYGIYQAQGVGYGYSHDNGGFLPFLDAEYRKEHRLDKPRRVGKKWGGYMTSGKPRKRRDWYYVKLRLSTRRMVEDLAGIYADQLPRVICEQISGIGAALG